MEDTTMSTRKTTSEKIEAAKIEKQQAEARIKKLLQEQKAEERKIRNHRLCKRGGLVEKLLPDLSRLTDEQFDTFVQKTLMSGFAEKILRGLVPPESESNAEPEVVADTVQNNDGDAAKTEVSSRNVGKKASAGTATAPRVSS
jgi:NCAIR mutase (PurE)-related protein